MLEQRPWVMNMFTNETHHLFECAGHAIILPDIYAVVGGAVQIAPPENDNRFWARNVGGETKSCLGMTHGNVKAMTTGRIGSILQYASKVIWHENK